MKKKSVLALFAVALIGGLGVQEASAGGATQYRNCRAMHREWQHGVARSSAAARAEVRDGYGRPHVSRALYRANRSLDANDDGVACEA